MDVLVIVILTITLVIFCARYILINERSLIGIFFLAGIRLFTLITRNHTRMLLEQYKKLNKSNVWKIKEKETKKYSIRKIDIDGLEASLFTSKADSSKKIILQLHGGGYEIDLPNNSLYFTKKYHRVAKSFDILTINYRVAPENMFPAAFEDSIKAYKWILENGYDPNDIIIAGDSAGGGLAVATVMYLRDNKLPLPKAIITMSAWTNLNNTGISFTQNYNLDPLFGKTNDSIVHISKYAQGMDKSNPYISPIYGSFNGFPVMLMQVGSYEMLLSDTLDVAKKARQEGVEVYETAYNGMFHLFQKYDGLIPEAKEAWDEIRFFIEELYN